MKKRFLALFLALVMALALAGPASAAKVDVRNMPEYAILTELPETLQRPARPTTLEQADLYGHPAMAGGYADDWSDESTLREITELTDSLTAGKTTDTQKMRAIFDWVSQNINYGREDNELWGKRYSELTAEQRRRTWEAGEPFYVYTNRLGICEGYANLCWLMGTIAGIPVAKLICYTSMGHARNAALLDGRWVFFDATEAWNSVDPDYSWDLDPYERASSYSSLDFYDGVYQVHAYSGDDANVVSAALRPGFQCPASVTIPAYATEVARSAFKGCTDLKSVTIPDGVTKIDGNAFEGCTGLESVTIPDSVTAIESGAFYGCTGLKRLTIPGSVTEISSVMFKGCTSLESVTISNGVTRIWREAFDGCTSLKSVTIPGSVTNMEAAFYGCTALESVTIERGVTSIGFSAFTDCTSLKNVTIPDTVKTIEDQAFWNCTSLESITIPDGVTTIGKLAFFGCTNLKYAALPDSVTSVDGSAFGNCPNLKQSATIPAGMTTIADGTFQDRTDLTSFVIPDHVTRIGNWAFRNCTNLQSVTIPNSVTTIDSWAFYGCTSLKSVTLPSSVTTIGNYAFAGCTGMTSMTIPEGVVSIGHYATSYTLTNITIPTSVTSIGGAIFGGSMTDVYYAGTEAQWKAIAIEEPNYLDRVTIHYNSPMPKPTEPEQPVAHPSTQTVTIDGKKVEFQTYSLKDEKGNDTNYIKIRDLALALKGTAAQFDVGMKDGVITFTSGGDYKPIGSENSTPYSGKQTYTKNSGEVSVNGTKYPIDAFQITHNGAGYTYFQMKDIAQKLNFNMAWRGSIVIETDKPYTGK